MEHNTQGRPPEPGLQNPDVVGGGSTQMEGGGDGETDGEGDGEGEGINVQFGGPPSYPGAQTLQFAADVDPGEGVVVFCGQGVQTAVPVVFENVPTGHC